MRLNFRKIYLGRFDWVLIISVLLLIVMGMSAIYSVDLSNGSELLLFKKQMIALLIGFALLFAAGFTQQNFFRATAKWWYVGSLLLLVLVLFAGQSIRGTTGWFVFAGFSFQPVEFAKVGLILMMAYIITHFGRRFERPLFFFGTLIVTLIMMALIMMQPDLGSALIVGSIWFALMILIGARKLFVVGLTMCGILLAVFACFFLLHDYQKDRITTFINPEKDKLMAGYNVYQSTIAVGSGKVFGRGLGYGSQSQLRFLPETQTDFIFSVIGEELGLVGVSILLILYVIILWRILLIIKNNTDDFSAVVASGVFILFLSQFIVNVGANIGLLPVTGVTLPFVSYGGSSLIMNLLLIGILESMVSRGSGG